MIRAGKELVRKAVLGASTAASLVLAPSSLAGGQGNNVDLRSQLNLTQLGASFATDCWGYTSPSGREYAIICLDSKTSIVEISDPDNPVIIGTVSHTFSGTGDAKVYMGYVYAANGSGGGIDIIDLNDVDNGTVTLVQRMTTGGVQWSHNIAINEDSGHLYLGIGNINGGDLVSYNLSDPENPFIDGMYSGRRSHDLQVVNYTSGPYAGREIAFSFAEGNGLDIIDVTDKSNMFLRSHATYSNTQYCHQGWVSDDKQFLYLNDELDNQQRTTVFDISDLDNPVFLNDFSSSTNATDHNCYIRDGFIFEANYRSGLRIFDLNQDPVNPPEVGYFDTHSATGGGFDGAWSNYPYYPSGMVIVSDTDNGLFVLDPSAATGGSGTVATLSNMGVDLGTLLGGGLPELGASDDAYVHTQSGFGQTLIDAHAMEMFIVGEAPGLNPDTLDITIESHIDQPTGTVQVRLKNFTTQEFDLVDTYAVGDSDGVETVKGLNAADYYNPNNGRVRVKIKHIVFVPFLAFQFESFIDQVEIVVR